MMKYLTTVPRAILGAALGLTAALAPCLSHAQDYPVKPIRLFIPFTPGGGTDFVSRVVATKLSETLKWQVIPENKPGASGTIGAEMVAKAAPDGHTIMVGPASALTAPHLYAKLNYDVIKDLQPITNIGSTSLVLAVHKAFPPNTLQEFIAYVKARPGQLKYASAGIGSPQHVTGALFAAMAGIDLVHVPYKGNPPAFSDVVGGHVDMMLVIGCVSCS